MAQTLQLLSVISFAIAGVCLVIAVFFWFFFKIPTVIGDLSGRTARKSIAKTRAANEKTGSKSYKESKANAERGKLTGTIPDISKQMKANSNPETGLLADNKATGFSFDETGLLDDDATGLLESGTTGLLEDEDATALLDPYKPINTNRTNGKHIEILEEVMLIHTDEEI